jgi:hypothetical protein
MPRPGTTFIDLQRHRNMGGGAVAVRPGRAPCGEGWMPSVGPSVVMSRPESVAPTGDGARPDLRGEPWRT